MGVKVFYGVCLYEGPNIALNLDENLVNAILNKNDILDFHVKELMSLQHLKVGIAYVRRIRHTYLIYASSLVEFSYSNSYTLPTTQATEALAAFGNFFKGVGHKPVQPEWFMVYETE